MLHQRLNSTMMCTSRVSMFACMCNSRILIFTSHVLPKFLAFTDHGWWGSCFYRCIPTASSRLSHSTLSLSGSPLHVSDIVICRPCWWAAGGGAEKSAQSRDLERKVFRSNDHRRSMGVCKLLETERARNHVACSPAQFYW